MLVALLLGALAFGEDKKPPLPPVTAALVEVLGPTRAAGLKQPPELTDIVNALRPDEKPAARTALHRLDELTEPRVLTELSRAYSLLGDDEAAMRASGRARAGSTGFQVEYQHAMSLARTGDYQAAYTEAVALNERYPGRPELVGLIASTRGRLSSQTVIEHPGVSITPASGGGRQPNPAALSAMSRAADTRATDPAASWAAVQEAMAADPTNPSVQELYRLAQDDRRRHRPASGPTDIDLSSNGVETPTGRRGGVPLWPVVPIGLLSAGGYVAVRRRQSTFTADHDFEANDYQASPAEKYLAGAFFAGAVAATLYVVAVESIAALPRAAQAVNSTGQQLTALASSQSGAIRIGGSNTTTLYRAVSFEEHAHLMSTGRLSASVNTLEGKFFAESAANAAEWGTKLQGAGNFKVVQFRIPTNIVNNLMRWERLDGIGPARYADPAAMNAINEAKPVIQTLK